MDDFPDHRPRIDRVFGYRVYRQTLSLSSKFDRNSLIADV